MIPDLTIYKSSTNSITESYSSITIPTKKFSTSIPQSMNSNMSISHLTFPNFPTSQPKISNVPNFQLENPNLETFISDLQSKIPNVQNLQPLISNSQPHISNAQSKQYQTEFMDFKDLPESRIREILSTPKIIHNGYEDDTIYRDWIGDNVTQQSPSEKVYKESSTNISQLEFDD